MLQMVLARIAQMRDRAPERVSRSCAECSDSFTVPADKASEGSKWWRLCPSCLKVNV